MTGLFTFVFFVLTIFISSCGQTSNPENASDTVVTGTVPASDILRIKVGNAPGSVEVADFNNDRFVDLAVTSETDSSVTILLGNGKGNFTEAERSPFFAGSIPNDIATGDFDKDGNRDLVFANHEKNYLTVLLGDGKGNFSPAKGSPFPTTGIPHTHGIATGDFNSDGQLDLVTDSWGNDQVEVLWGDNLTLFKTPGSFFKVGKRPYQRHRAGDVNGDGLPDIITTNSESNNVSVLLSDGKGGFNEASGSPFPAGDAPFGLSIDDVNADGRTDLAIINSPGSMAEGKGKNGMTVLLGDGTGKFSMMKGSPFEAGKIPNRIATGDVNGDGVNDIVTSDNDTREIYLFQMNKNGNVSSQSAVTVGNHPKGIAITDLNGDGKEEIVVCNVADNDISIITGQ
ncbi:MAG TPA: VCBS repeat-containing protein [Bacteroidia bacterium]|nr:VCBS repeat-containing protein [Bacteroidia bacterium]